MNPLDRRTTDPFAEDCKAQVSIDATLTRFVEETFGLRIRRPEPLFGGEESAVWKVDAEGTRWVIRISPTWCFPTEFETIYDIVAHVARVLPEVPAPLRGTNGKRVIAFRGHPISVHPFIAGDFIDPADPTQRAAAARLLARVHGAFTGITHDLGTTTTMSLPTDHDPAGLNDPDLDAWLADLPNRPWHVSLIHGDFYARNILWANDRIVGLLDWDELAADYREQEVAWAIWEFCQNDAGTRLNLHSARRFLNEYLQAGGIVASYFAQEAERFTRRRLRRECRAALAQRDRGEPFDAAYFEAEVAAFANLRGVSLA